MPDTATNAGTSWQRAFPAEALRAREARTWAAMHAVHPDARQVAGELFLAVLAGRPSLVQMTVSTAGPRRRITATGTWPLAMRDVRGAGRSIIAALSIAHGLTVDDRGVWAELTWEAT